MIAAFCGMAPQPRVNIFNELKRRKPSFQFYDKSDVYSLLNTPEGNRMYMSEPETLTLSKLMAWNMLHPDANPYLGVETTVINGSPIDEYARFLMLREPKTQIKPIDSLIEQVTKSYTNIIDKYVYFHPVDENSVYKQMNEAMIKTMEIFRIPMTKIKLVSAFRDTPSEISDRVDQIIEFLKK